MVYVSAGKLLECFIRGRFMCPSERYVILCCNSAANTRCVASIGQEGSRTDILGCVTGVAKKGRKANSLLPE